MASPETLVIARVLHVVGVVLWIGGMAFVTTVVLPSVRNLADAARQPELFEMLEGRFAWQARFVTLVTGLSGFFMLHGLDAWDRYRDPAYWWVHLMTFVWLVFTLVLFVLEPLFLHRWFERAAREHPERTLRAVHRGHWVLLSLSLVAIAGAVAGSRGFLRF